jgi:hypothetical protein
VNGRRPMNENNKPPKLLSDLALERVMRDVLSGGWQISAERAQQEINKGEVTQNEHNDQSELSR